MDAPKKIGEKAENEKNARGFFVLFAGRSVSARTSRFFCVKGRLATTALDEEEDRDGSGSDS